MSHHRDFNSYYIGFLSHFYKQDFPNLLSYTRFLDVMPAGIEFIDFNASTFCHNIRIPRYKTVDGLAKRGKGTMGWFYDFKLHINVNYMGEIVAAKVTTANVYDTKPAASFTQGLSDKLYGDRGYLVC